MDILTELLKKKFGDKYDYLKFYDVIYDRASGECVVTFLYPMTMKDVPQEAREEIEREVSEYLRLHATTKVKFKKSFNDVRILKRDIKHFVDTNFKAVSIYLTEEQIEIENIDDKILVTIHLNSAIKDYYEANKISSKIRQFLVENNIGDFVVDMKVDDSFVIQKDVGDVEILVEQKRKIRYQVEYVKKIVGGTIAPEPELIKNQASPKQSVILAGFVSNLNMKEYVAKSGLSKGKNKKLYTFNLNDGAKIECVYFCPKTNEKLIESLENDMYVLCLGNLDFNFNGKLTYYPKNIAYASQIEKIEDIVEEEQKNTITNHKQTIFGQKYSYTMQSDLFAQDVKYNDYIMNNTFVIYDLETTGLSSATDDIIEIGAVKIEKGKVTEYFSTFVNPQKHIPDEATQINNITDDMVKDAPNISDAIIDFYRFCQGSIVGGYNSDNFDNKFIKSASKKVGFNFDNDFIDVMVIATHSNLAPKNFKLISVCQYLGISLVDAHRAYNDAFATAKVLLKLNEEK